MSERGFFSRIFGRNVDDDETRVYSAEEIGLERGGERRSQKEERRLRGFTVERAAGIIDELPRDVSRESALRIVRGTLMATGIRFEDLERSTRIRESRLNSEIDLARSRQEDLRERTEEVVRSLEEEIEKARAARDTGIAEEEENISNAERSLEEVERVRAFFGFPEPEEEETTAPPGDTPGDETRALEPLDDVDGTQRSWPPAAPDTTDER